MRVMVTLENRFLRTKNGNIYSTTVCDYNFWKRYLQVFDEVVVLARLRESPELELNKPTANGKGVIFKPLPTYIGIKQYMLKYHQIVSLAKDATEQADAFILRIPGRISTILWRELIRREIPYGVEVVGCSQGSAETCGTNFLIKNILKQIGPRIQKKQCFQAAASAYVSKNYLQKNYPPNNWSTYYSSINLTDEAIISPQELKHRLKTLDKKIQKNKTLNICHVGTMTARYKVQDILIEAVAKCRNNGNDVSLTLLGEGKFKDMFLKKAKDYNIFEFVHFAGAVPPGKDVREVLDKADIFVLPSLTEGLPRSLIEAMARGLPCIGSNVGGIPELLPEKYLVEPGNVEKLTEKIISVIKNPKELKDMATVNWENSKEFSEKKLNKKRIEFYKKVVEFTKQPLSKGQS